MTLVETKSALDPAAGMRTRDELLRVLSLSLVYPNPKEPGLGTFVRARLRYLNQAARVKVIAPIAVTDYAARRLRLIRPADARQWDGEMEVLHPGWVYAPGGTPLNVLCLLGRIAPAVARMRKQFPFHVIDAHFGYPEGVVAAHLAKMFRCPFTITLRGSEPMFARHRFRRRYLQWALQRAGAVIAVSENLRRFAMELGADSAKIFTIPNGVDKEVYNLRDCSEVRSKHRIAPAARVVVSAGELIEAKGHHLAIQAVADLIRQGIDAELFIAGGIARGGRPFENELRRAISKCGIDSKVHMLGWLPPEDLAGLMSAADVFCLASYTEGWPNVVNEALACGCPVVASDVGAVRDMIPSKKFGIVVPPRNQPALTQALHAALKETWDRNAIAAWGQSRSWDQVAREVMDVMQQLTREAHVRN